MAQVNVEAPLTQELLVVQISHMLPDALTAAGVVPATEFSQNLCEAIVAVLRESIVAAIPKMLEVIPTPPSPAADPDPSVAEGVDPDLFLKVYVCLYLHYLVGVFLFLSFFLYMFFVLFLRRPLKYFQFLLL